MNDAGVGSSIEKMIEGHEDQIDPDNLATLLRNLGKPEAAEALERQAEIDAGAKRFEAFLNESDKGGDS